MKTLELRNLNHLKTKPLQNRLMKLDSRSRREPAGQQSEATGSCDSMEAAWDPLATAGAFQDFTRDFAHVPTFTVTNLTSNKIFRTLFGTSPTFPLSP